MTTRRLNTHSSASRLDQMDRNQVNQINKRFHLEKSLQRREERSKLVTENRNRTQPGAANTPLPPPPPTSRCPPARSTSMRNIRTASGDDLMSEQTLHDRRKLLDQWRKSKAEEMKKAKLTQRPVFKVRHVETKEIYGRGERGCSSQNTTLSRRDESRIEPNRPLTRSQTKGLQASKSTSSLQPTPSVKDKAFDFGIKKWASQSKFTFTATLSDQPAKYEDFCQPLYLKDEPVKEEEPVAAESSQADQAMTTTSDQPPLGSKKTTVIETLKASSSSYRRSRSGMYKVDMQSSILEFDSTRTDHHSSSAGQVEELTSKLNLVVTLDSEPTGENKENVKRQQMKTEIEIVVEEVKFKKDEPEDPRATDLTFDFESVALESRDVKYYRSLVINRTKLLNDYSSRWLSLCDNSEAPEDVQGEIRSACGLAQLLIDERFDQFSELIDQCEASAQKQQVEGEEDGGVKLVLCSDLQGFWDMVEYQVRDVEKKFAYLKLLKDHDYLAENIPVHFLNPPAAKTAPAAKKKFIKPFVAKKKPADPEATADQPKKPAPARSKFAEFREKMKKGAQDPQAEPTPGVEEAKAILPLSSLDCDMLLELASKPKEEAPLPDTNPPVACSSDVAKTVSTEPARTVKIRSRPSDLIIFDSPVKPATSRAFRGQDIAESVCETTAPPCISINPASPELAPPEDENKENNTSFGCGAEGDDSFFSFAAVKPITWRQNAATTPKLNSLRAGQQQQNKSPLTPRMTNESRDSLAGGAGGAHINSPLLKLAYISSHGKRSSLSTNKNF